MRCVPAIASVASLIGVVAAACLATACIKAPAQRTDVRTAHLEGAQDAADATDATDAADSADTDSGATDTGGGNEWLDAIEADASLTYYNFAKDVLDAHCVKCHGATATGGAPDSMRLDVFADVAGVAGVSTSLTRIVARVGDNTMPPTADGDFTDAERKRLAAWFKGGGKKGSKPPTPVAPFIAFVQPNALHKTATANEFVVSVTIAGAPTGATWELYYTAVSGAITGGARLIAGLPTTTTSYSWLMLAVPDGEYFLYAILNAGDIDVAAASAGSIAWDNPLSVNAPPTITLTGLWTGNSNNNRAVVLPATITYTIADADVGDTHTVKIDYRSGGGAWQNIVTGHTHATQYVWDDSLSPMSEGVAYELRLTVDDGEATDEDTSTAVFGIASRAYSFIGDTAPILAGCTGGGCHDPVSGDWTVYAAVLPKVDAIMTRAIDTDLDMVQTNLSPISAPNKLIYRLWRWQGAPE